MPSFRRKKQIPESMDKGDLFETKLMLTGIAELLGCYIPADFFVTQKSHFVT